MAISRQVAAAITSKLADPKTGFNATLATVCASGLYQIPAEKIDFSHGSPQFFKVKASLGQLTAMGIDYRWPLAQLYFGNARQNPADIRTKPRMFDGAVHFTLDFYHSYPDDPSDIDFEGIFDATFDACVRIFNGIAVPWPNGITYGGEIDETMRSELAQDGEEGPIYRFQRIVLGFRIQQ